ncbi:MAG: hypothetical protein JXK05_07190 [Campylobacterales bacterium]|nr:hypothetical protein [Campylobacterales bacterium]
MKKIGLYFITSAITALIAGCDAGNTNPSSSKTMDENSPKYAKPIKIGAMVWGDYSSEEIHFIANEPRIKLVSCLGNVDPDDALLLKQLNPQKPSLWFRTALNVGEHINEQTFLGFWTKERYAIQEDAFSHYNTSTTDLVSEISIEFGFDPQYILHPNNRVIDTLWSTALADPSSPFWKRFWQEEVQKQVVQEQTFSGVRMDVFYEQLEGWTKPAVALTQQQYGQLKEKLLASPELQNRYGDAINAIYHDRLPSTYDPKNFRADMLTLIGGVKEGLDAMPLAVNPMWPSYDGTFAFYQEYAAVADILEIKMFVTQAGISKESYQPQDVWSRQIGTMIWNELNGKTTLAFARGLSFDTQRRIYALASYLLGQGEKSLFYYEALDFELSAERLGYWAQFSYLPEWELAIGKALERPQPHAQQNSDPTLLLQQYYDADLGVYVRRYENGMVFVNPTNQRQRAAYHFDKSVYLVQPVGGNVSPIHRMEDPSILEDEKLENIISKNPDLKDHFNRVGTLLYTTISSIQLNPREAAIVLFVPEPDQD